MILIIDNLLVSKYKMGSRIVYVNLSSILVIKKGWMMKKKTLASCQEMHRLFNFGDFLTLRKMCHNMRDSSLSEEKALCTRMLRITKADPLAMLAGALVLLLVLAVSFWLAY